MLTMLQISHPRLASADILQRRIRRPQLRCRVARHQPRVQELSRLLRGEETMRTR